jgi:hypothetical protein
MYLLLADPYPTLHDSTQSLYFHRPRTTPQGETKRHKGISKLIAVTPQGQTRFGQGIQKKGTVHVIFRK